MSIQVVSVRIIYLVFRIYYSLSTGVLSTRHRHVIHPVNKGGFDSCTL